MRISTSLWVALLALSALPMQAQTITVIHSFSGGADGAYPLADLIIDKAGNFYGTTFNGGSSACGAVGCGLVFKLLILSDSFYVIGGQFDSTCKLPQLGRIF
jgi:hypothetical protein